MKDLNEIIQFVRKILNEQMPPPKQLVMTDWDLSSLLWRAFECETEEEVGRIFREVVFGDPDYVHPPSGCPLGAMM